MKKFLIIGIIIATGISANAVVNMPDSAPIYNAPRRQENSAASQNSSSNSSTSVASIARQLAKELHYRDNNAPELQIKMQQNGVEGLSFIGRLPCPETGKIVPIKVGNKTYTGHKKCSVVVYQYKGQEYSEGICE